MPVVSTINYKGGVGKTTLTANVGAELAWRGYDVLLVDLDPQASLTFSFVKPDWWNSNLAQGGTIKSWYDATSSGDDMDLSSLVHEPEKINRMLGRSSRSKTLGLIPSHLGLINVDLELATELGGANIRQAKRRYLTVHRRLAEGLAHADFFHYDVVLIDCPPNFNIVTKTAIVASDYVLIPAKPDYLSTLGIDYLQRNLDELVKDYNEYVELDAEGDDEAIDPELLGIVFTMVKIYNQQPVSAQRNFIAQTRRLRVPVFDQYVRENKSVHAGAPEEGAPVVLMNTDYQGLRTELEELTDEFIRRLGI